MKRVVVTGANKGIGLAIVRAILDEHDDTFVWLGSRDQTRGAAARDGLVDAHAEWDDRLQVLPLDVASEASVRAAAERLADAGPLYGLVNNAGIGIGDVSLRDVLEVNTIGLRRVTDAFVPLLDPERGRVVNITSASGPNFVSRCSEARKRFLCDPTLTRAQLQAFIDECLAISNAAESSSRPSGPEFAAAGLSNGEPYGLSKALGNAYTQLFAREHPNLAINACTPGFIQTDLTAPYLARGGRTAEELGMKPPSAGARAPMFLLFGDLEGNGRYYGSDAQRSPLHEYRSPGAPPYRGE